MTIFTELVVRHPHVDYGAAILTNVPHTNTDTQSLGFIMKHLMMVIFAFLITTAVFAKGYSYQCFSYYWNGYENIKGTMNVEINGKVAKADILEVSWDDNLGGTLNPTYISLGAIKFVKFGYGLLLEEVLISGGKQLYDGSIGGIARVEGQAEGGFYQYKFICKR